VRDRPRHARGGIEKCPGRGDAAGRRCAPRAGGEKGRERGRVRALTPAADCPETRAVSAWLAFPSAPAEDRPERSEASVAAPREAVRPPAAAVAENKAPEPNKPRGVADARPRADRAAASVAALLASTPAPEIPETAAASTGAPREFDREPLAPVALNVIDPPPVSVAKMKSSCGGYQKPQGSPAHAFSCAGERATNPAIKA
jgi:hypothetical protein